MPYDLVSPAVWDRVMPHWMEAIHNDIPEDDLQDLRITLRCYSIFKDTFK